jgi:hypothetical protein
MSQYVEIRTSPAEIMSIANGIRSRGEQLESSVRSINDEITAHEAGPETLPLDQFTERFNEKYRAPTTTAAGLPAEANVAVRDSAQFCGAKLVDIGETVSAAMMNYGATDDDSGQDIAKTV